MKQKQTEIMEFPKGLHIYYYNRKGQMVGVFAATESQFDSHYYGIGWSLCNVKQGDIFNKNLAKKIAYDRAFKGSACQVPISMHNKYYEYVRIAAKYFKDKEYLGNAFTF